MTHALRIRFNALVLVAVLLVGLVILPGTPDVKPGSSVSAVKPPPIKPCRWMWFGNWQMCIR